MKHVIFIVAFLVVAVYALYTFVNFYDKHLHAARMQETPAVRPYEHPLLVMQEGTVPYQGGEELYKAEAAAGQLPSAKEPESIVDFGKKEYQAFCSHCHGDNLDGLGTVGQSFNPLPTNLTSDRVKQMTDAYIFSAISYGTKSSPPLATTMSVESRDAVIAYIRYKQGEKQ